MFKYIEYDIETLQNVKLARTDSKEDSEESIDYISGSAIRGAFIYKYIKKYGVDISQGIHKKKIFSGDITFLNAYPKHDDKRSMPFPKCYFAPKDEMKKFKKSNSTLEIKLRPDIGYERVRLCNFAVANDDLNNYKGIKVEKESNLHINKNKTDSKTKMFRYESIKRGQVFRGIIRVKEEYIDEVRELLNDSIIYIGGSKGNGYGQCKIKNMSEAKEKNPEYELYEKKNSFDKKLYLIAISDIIYRNKLGEYKTFIDEDFLEEKLGLDKVSFVNSNIEIHTISGFNNKWNCRIPQVVGIKAGSVFEYDITGKVDNHKLIEFMNEGIGERRTEGYGRFVIVDSISDAKFEMAEKEEKEDKLSLLRKKRDLEGKLSDSEKKQIQNLLNSIYRKRITDQLSKEVESVTSDLKDGDRLNNSQWGKLMNLFKELKYMQPEEGIGKFEKYKERVMNKTGSYGQNKTAYEQLKYVKIKEDNILDYFTEIVKNSISITWLEEDDLIDSFEEFDVGMDENFAYRVNMEFLSELCRYQLRKEEE